MPPESQPGPSDVATALQFAKDHLGHTVTPLVGPNSEYGVAVVMPAGLKLQSIKPFVDEWRDRPVRREGTATLMTLDSFIAHAVRFKDRQSMLFVDPDPKAPYLLSVLDYHEAAQVMPPDEQGTWPGQPRFGRHRGVYRFPLSEEWKAWMAKNGQGMGQADFAEFLEDRIADVLDPAAASQNHEQNELVKALKGTIADPARLIDLSRGLSVRAESTVRQQLNLSSGEVQIQWDEEHKDSTGVPLKIPNLFLLAIPVFDRGLLYEIHVRLRYRVSAGKVTWFYELHRPDRYFRHALDRACDKARADTGLPLLYGTPEGG